MLGIIKEPAEVQVEAVAMAKEAEMAEVKAAVEKMEGEGRRKPRPPKLSLRTLSLELKRSLDQKEGR